MSSLNRKQKKEKYKTQIHGRQVKLDRPIKTHEAVLPLKDERQIDRLIEHAIFLRDREHSQFKRYIAYRNYILILLGLNTALRAEDLLQLKVRSINRERIWITENKTQKQQDFFLSKEVQKEVELYIHEFQLQPEEYLFQSRKQSVGVRDDLPITRAQSHKIMREFASFLGIKYSFGLHSLRKTFGYQYIKHAKNSWSALNNLQRMYNHGSIRTTQIYICWDTDDLEKTRENIAIGIKRKY